jgi:hypothetical protein
MQLIMNENECNRISALIVKKVRGRISRQENKELHNWATCSGENQALLDKFLNQSVLIRELFEFNELDTTPIWNKLGEKVPSLNSIHRREIQTDRRRLRERDAMYCNYKCKHLYFSRGNTSNPQAYYP